MFPSSLLTTVVDQKPIVVDSSIGANSVNTRLDQLFEKLSTNSFVELYSNWNDTYKLGTYIWNNQLLPVPGIRSDVYSQMNASQSEHRKNEEKACELLKQGDGAFCRDNFLSAIVHYTQAIKKVPHTLALDHQCYLAKLYAKRAVSFYMINSIDNGNYDYRCASSINVNIGQQALEKTLAILHCKTGHLTLQEQNKILQNVLGLKKAQSTTVEVNDDKDKNVALTIVTNSIVAAVSVDENGQNSVPSLAHTGAYFSPSIMSLWFNNRHKGKRHSAGAHFLCAKTDLRPGTVIMEERVNNIVTASLDSFCVNCNKPVGLSFWPCDGCDEVVYCSIKCSQNSTYHVLECGCSSYFRKQMSPLGAILFNLYTRSVCMPEYCAKVDMEERPKLSTDADQYFVNQPNRSKLPKRSYQYRHYLLYNESARKILVNPTVNELKQKEALLAVRESADNKDEMLPLIAKNELISIILESIQLLFVIEFVLGEKDDNNGIGENEGLKSSKNPKERFLAILEDYKRLYRLNIGQGFEDSSMADNAKPEDNIYFPKQDDNDNNNNNANNNKNNLFFIQPIIGTFFWPDCNPNIDVKYHLKTQTLIYQTIRNVNKYDKFTISFPSDYAGQNCKCLSCGGIHPIRNDRQSSGEISPIQSN